MNDSSLAVLTTIWFVFGNTNLTSLDVGLRRRLDGDGVAKTLQWQRAFEIDSSFSIVGIRFLWHHYIIFIFFINRVRTFLFHFCIFTHSFPIYMHSLFASFPGDLAINKYAQTSSSSSSTRKARLLYHFPLNNPAYSRVYFPSCTFVTS